MAERHRHPFERGPYLAAAVLCERILTEQDGVNSLVRIVDRVTHTVTGPNPPPTLQPFEYTLWAFIAFKSGSARGTKELTIRAQKPSGESLQPQTFPMNFEGEDDRGANLAVQMQLTLDMAGVWWFEISLDAEVVTRLPFRIIYMRQSVPMPPGQSGQLG